MSGVPLVAAGLLASIRRTSDYRDAPLSNGYTHVPDFHQVHRVIVFAQVYATRQISLPAFQGNLFSGHYSQVFPQAKVDHQPGSELSAVTVLFTFSLSLASFGGGSRSRDGGFSDNTVGPLSPADIPEQHPSAARGPIPSQEADSIPRFRLSPDAILDRHGLFHRPPPALLSRLLAKYSSTACRKKSLRLRPSFFTLASIAFSNRSSMVMLTRTTTPVLVYSHSMVLGGLLETS